MTSENPYRSPKLAEHSDAERQVGGLADGSWRDGDLVVVSPAGLLPKRCVVCNQASSHTVSWSVNGGALVGKKGTRRDQRLVMVAIVTSSTVGFWLFAVRTQLMAKLAQSLPAIAGIVSVAVMVMLQRWISYGLRKNKPYPHLQIGMCRNHYRLLWLGRGFILLCLTGALFAAISVDFPDVSIVKTMGKFRLGIIFVMCLGMSLIASKWQSRVFQPVLVKQDESRFFWISGFSPTFVQSLPAWQVSAFTP